MQQSRFIQRATLYHAIPGAAQGDAIKASANWGIDIHPPERAKLGIGPDAHPPLVFAATHLAKAVAFSIEKGQGRLCNATIDSAAAEILVTGDRDAFMSRPRDATVYSFQDQGFVNLPNAQQQSVSLKDVPFDQTNVALKVNSIEDVMKAGLQIFTFKEDAAAVYKDKDALKLSGAKNNEELLETLSSLIKSGKVVWENNSRGINPNPALAKQLGIVKAPKPVKKNHFRP